MGKVDVYERDEDAIVDGHVTIIRVNPLYYDPYFVAYYLRSYLGQVQIEKWFSGSSGQIELQPDEIRQFILPAPDDTGLPLAEQQRIAALITEQLTEAHTLEAASAQKWAEARAMFESRLL